MQKKQTWHLFISFFPERCKLTLYDGLDDDKYRKEKPPFVTDNGITNYQTLFSSFKKTGGQQNRDKIRDKENDDDDWGLIFCGFKVSMSSLIKMHKAIPRLLPGTFCNPVISTCYKICRVKNELLSYASSTMIRTCIASAGLLNFLLYFFSLKHGQLPR
jgi:hypothetical protein